MLSCVNQGIDLFGQLHELLAGEKILVPASVITELSNLGKDKKLKMSEREAAELAVQLLDNEKIVILDLKERADESIVNYALKNSVVVASLDNGIRARLPRVRFLTIKARKRVTWA